MGFIEAEGSFYIKTEGKKPEFNLTQTREAELLTQIGIKMGLTMKNQVSRKANETCVLTAASREDIQAVIRFMTAPDRVRLQGLKKVAFLK